MYTLVTKAVASKGSIYTPDASAFQKAGKIYTEDSKAVIANGAVYVNPSKTPATTKPAAPKTAAKVTKPPSKVAKIPK